MTDAWHRLRELGDAVAAAWKSGRSGVGLLRGRDRLELLEEHEARFWQNYPGPDASKRGCGIACPECGSELWADHSVMLTSDPPQTPIHCRECGWGGSMH